MKVTAKVTRSGDWWAIEVPEVPGVYTQTKRLDQVDEMVRDAVALMVEVDPGSIEVEPQYELPQPVRDKVYRSRELAAEAARLQLQASQATRDVIMVLRDDEHLSVRDVGKILEVSPQRVSQLAAFKESRDKIAAVRKKAKSQLRSSKRS